MAWSTPLTAVSNATLTAAQWNATVRDNMLETAPAKFTAAGRIFVSTAANAGAERVIDSTEIAGSSTTSSTSYGGLAAGTGPAVTVTTGTRALVFVTAKMSTDTTGVRAYAAVAVTGATTYAASDADALHYLPYGINADHRGTSAILFKALTAGSNTFTMQYKTSGGGTSAFANRSLTVIAL